MALLPDNCSLGREIIEALDGPKHCRAVTLRHTTGSIPIVIFECLVVGEEKVKKIRTIVKRYKLQDRTPQGGPN